MERENYSLITCLPLLKRPGTRIKHQISAISSLLLKSCWECLQRSRAGRGGGPEEFLVCLFTHPHSERYPCLPGLYLSTQEERSWHPEAGTTSGGAPRVPAKNKDDKRQARQSTPTGPSRTRPGRPRPSGCSPAPLRPRLPLSRPAAASARPPRPLTALGPAAATQPRANLLPSALPG